MLRRLVGFAEGAKCDHGMVVPQSAISRNEGIRAGSYLFVGHSLKLRAQCLLKRTNVCVEPHLTVSQIGV
jgi:hypothetical protein